ncbi:hypothetical protein WA158_007520 [Blastocystis sp. Blastoise]
MTLSSSFSCVDYASLLSRMTTDDTAILLQLNQKELLDTNLISSYTFSFAKDSIIFGELSDKETNVIRESIFSLSLLYTTRLLFLNKSVASTFFIFQSSLDSPKQSSFIYISMNITNDYFINNNNNNILNSFFTNPNVQSVFLSYMNKTIDIYSYSNTYICNRIQSYSLLMNSISINCFYLSYSYIQTKKKNFIKNQSLFHFPLFNISSYSSQNISYSSQNASYSSQNVSSAPSLVFPLNIINSTITYFKENNIILIKDESILNILYSNITGYSNSLFPYIHYIQKPRNISIYPSLPSSLYINETTGQIEGITDSILIETQYILYTMQTETIAIFTHLYISIKPCNSSNIPVTFLLIPDNEDIFFTMYIYTINKRLLYMENMNIYNESSSVSLCLPAARYYVSIIQRVLTPWKETAIHISSPKDDSIYISIFNSTTIPIMQPFMVTFVSNIRYIPYHYWYYPINPPSDWASLTFDDSDWLLCTLSSTIPPLITSIPLISFYYRIQHTILLHDTTISALKITLLYSAGMIVYINGIEIERYNMPSGSLTNTTLATNQYSSLTSIAITVPIDSYYFKQAINIIAVEFHNYQEDPAGISPTFQFHFANIPINQYILDTPLSFTQSISTLNHPLENLFDHSIYTKYTTYSTCRDTIILWYYYNSQKVFANSYSLTNGDNCNTMHPTDWKLEGSRIITNSTSFITLNNNNTIWDLLHVGVNETWSRFYETKQFNFFTLYSYAQFKLSIRECNSIHLNPLVSPCESGFQLSSINLYSNHNEVYCEEINGYSRTSHGTYSYKPCPSNYEGIKRRFCNNGIFNEEENSCHLFAPYTFYYQRNSITCYISIDCLIQINNVNQQLSFYSIPSLPSGLYISEYGNIMGIPLITSESQSYTIIGNNTLGIATTTIYIQVMTAYCQTDNEWIQIEPRKTRELNCIDISHYIGKRRRYCKPSSPPSWDIIQDDCTPIPPSIQYPSSTYKGYIKSPITPIAPLLSGYYIPPLVISPELPSSITFNENNGIIYGTPLKTLNKTYTITISNPSISIYTTLTIIILSIHCNSEGIWNDTPIGETQYLLCDEPFIGYQSRDCVASSENTATWSSINHNYCSQFDSSKLPNEYESFIYIPLRLYGISESQLSNGYTYYSFYSLFTDIFIPFQSMSFKYLILFISNQNTIDSSLYNGDTLNYNTTKPYLDITNIILYIQTTPEHETQIVNDLYNYIQGEQQQILEDCHSIQNSYLYYLY